MRSMTKDGPDKFLAIRRKIVQFSTQCLTAHTKAGKLATEPEKTLTELA